MSSPNNLEITGNLTEHPLAEILVEILEARLDGSLRLSHHHCKAIFYLKNCELVFAVSNQRQHRLFEMLLKAGSINKQQLLEISEFTNDLVLAKALLEKGMFSQNSLQAVMERQIEAILLDAVNWKEGTWIFSPLARIKDDIKYKIDVFGLLIEYARKLPTDAVVRRFKSFKETFGKRPAAPVHIKLLPREAFLLSRFEHSFLKIEEMSDLTGMSDSENMQALYTLWLGGFLFRKGWGVALTERRISDILSAKLELKLQTPDAPEPPTPKGEVKVIPVTPDIPAEPPKEELTLEKYLSRVENAETHYQILDVPIKATVPEIKQAYFGLAKRFHPDIFYKKADAESHRRIQHAFTEIAHAYETLRHEESRTRYDYRLRKILEELEKFEAADNEKITHTTHKKLTEASEIFDHGFNLLMEEEYESALPYLSRAVIMAPDVARYRAYFGKILSIDKTQKFKAEAELQTAVKLDPDNPLFRLMLAEFFIEYNLLKRAEGELNRLLTIDPDNAEAKAMLDRLR